MTSTDVGGVVYLAVVARHLTGEIDASSSRRSRRPDCPAGAVDATLRPLDDGFLGATGKASRSRAWARSGPLLCACQPGESVARQTASHS